jgi:hypothetical protein
MKTVMTMLASLLACSAALYGAAGSSGVGTGSPILVDVSNQIDASQSQNTSVTSVAEGGSSWNDNRSTSQVNINTNSTSNYQTRTPPLTTLPPYLPYWSHGGWGTVQGYFPNGPTQNDTVYETTYSPDNAEEMRELRTVLTSLPTKGVLESVGDMFNGVSVAFGGADTRHHGRGFEICNSVIRTRRPAHKPLTVFIDSNVDPRLLREQGYVYVGKIGVEGGLQHNWDQVYMAAVAEAMPWDVDLLLVSGGMKGVTVGSNVTFPSGAFGYSQVNYSLALFGSVARGIIESKGKSVLSAEAYRLAPDMLQRRRIPDLFYDRVRMRPKLVTTPNATAAPAPVPRPAATPLEQTTGKPAVPQAPPDGAVQNGQVLPRLTPATTPPQEAAPAPTTPESQPPAEPSAARPAGRGPGIDISRELFNMSGFQDDRQVRYLNVH